MSVRLFVGNLSFDVTEDELRALFAAAGPPTFVRIPTDRETGKPRGFAFVEFGERPQAEEAVRRFNQQLFKGRPLAVNEARARGEAPPPGSPAPGAFRPASSGPGSAPPRPGMSPRPAPRPSSWVGEPGTADEGTRPGQPRRTFGPDARPRDKRKREGQAPKGERVPKGPIRERGGGQVSLSEENDDGGEDFFFWSETKGGDDE